MIVLITAAATEKAYQLKSKLPYNTVLLGDYKELPQVMVSSGKMLKLPNPAGAAYLHEMLALCLDKGITTVYALRPGEFELLQEAELLFGEYGIHIKQAADAL